MQKSDRRRSKAMEEELAWIRQGPKGRQAKSKARIARFDSMQAAVADERSKEKFLSGQIVIPPGPRLGDVVIRADGLSKAVDGRVLFRDVHFTIPKGAIVGVIGANGTGKTTLLRVLTGDMAPDSGALTIGKSVVMSLVTQSRDALAGNLRVIDAVCGNQDSITYGE